MEWKLTNATRKHVAHYKSLFEGLHINTRFIHNVFGRPTRKETGEFAIERNKILGNAPTL
jgi:hypothetical protein